MRLGVDAGIFQLLEELFVLETELLCQLVYAQLTHERTNLCGPENGAQDDTVSNSDSDSSLVMRRSRGRKGV